MRRRALLTALAVGVSVAAGCLNRGSGTSDTSNRSQTNADSAADAPAFDVDDDAPGAFVLLRNQPQDPNGIVVGDEFDVGVVLGNAGGEPVTGDVRVRLVAPTGEGDGNGDEDENVQTATIAVDGDDELPAGAARFFTTGPFDATVAGDWKLTAESGIKRVHRAYDPIIEVEERPDD
ncbi:hypothetical protein OB955_18690 [Halobacteria archaeon AArc-m2/3/4]|uniref:Uncharacterized protein n=1 Tax=Natronoglomus mannanivorans TaxID=2979990 RepID=A0ABT2QIL2_9EURY|nr:hypothetical protein [Halobacteria archaeon AArc-m2/3/4]